MVYTSLNISIVLKVIVSLILIYRKGKFHFL